MTTKVYNVVGQHKLMTRVQARWPLDPWHACGGIHAQSEQCADEYQYEYWVPRRQELQAPPEPYKTGCWQQKWRLTTVVASVHDDLPFVLSGPALFLTLRPNMTAGSEYLLPRGLSLLAQAACRE